MYQICIYYNKASYARSLLKVFKKKISLYTDKTL